MACTSLCPRPSISTTTRDVEHDCAATLPPNPDAFLRSRIKLVSDALA